MFNQYQFEQYQWHQYQWNDTDGTAGLSTILLEDSTDLNHEGAGDILMEGEDITLVIPTRTALGLAIGSEVIDTGLAIGSEVITGDSN